MSEVKIIKCIKAFKDKTNEDRVIQNGQFYKTDPNRAQFLIDNNVCEDVKDVDTLLIKKYSTHISGPNFKTSDGQKIKGKAKTLEYIKNNLLD